MFLKKLQDLGLKKEEAKVYISLLELGSSYVSLIAKKAGVNRVACYHTLDKLTQDGLISSFEQNKIKYFSVESPKILVNKQKEKLEKAQHLLPELLSITNKLAYKPKIQYYEGAEGIKNIFEDTLSEKNEILGYTNLEKLPATIPTDFLKDHIKKRIEKGIKVRMLSPLSKNALSYTEKYYPKNFDTKLLEIFFINKEQFIFEYEINIYTDKVAIISLNPDEMVGLIIQSKFFAQTQRSAFNLAWLGATSFVVR